MGCSLRRAGGRDAEKVKTKGVAMEVRWFLFGIYITITSLMNSTLAEEPPRVTVPPESFFAIVNEADRDVAREFYAKYISVSGMPVVASKEVSESALQRTWEIVHHMLAGRPDVIQQLVDSEMYLIIIGRDQLYTDMPENRRHPNPDFVNERVRGTGGRPTSFGEENLLSLPIDRYDDESIAVHEFAHTIDGALSRMDPEWRKEKQAAYDNAMANGLYRNAYASSNAGEYFAETVQAYFDCDRVNNWNHNFVKTREQLKQYDPAGYDLVRRTLRLSPTQDWRYQWMRKLPNIIPPPKKFQIDPYYQKFTYAREFPIVGRAACDPALLKANDTVRKMFAYRHDLLKTLINRGVKMVVLAEDERVADLPELSQVDSARHDLLTRSLGFSPDHNLIVVDERNVLGDPRQEAIGSNQTIQLMADAVFQCTANRPVDPNWELRGNAVQQYELRVKRLDKEFGERVDRLFRSAREQGKWKGTSAWHSPQDYWTAGVLAWFDAAGQDGVAEDARFPIQTREQLQEYDPPLDDLVREVMAYEGHVDWRYRPLSSNDDASTRP